MNDCEATIIFSKRINDLFDALNRRYSLEGIRENSNDFKVSKTSAIACVVTLSLWYNCKVLEDSLQFLNKWENMVIDGKIKDEEFLTRSTADGLRVTILSTIELSNYLLKNKFKYVLTAKMNQDPLEVSLFFILIVIVALKSACCTFLK